MKVKLLNETIIETDENGEFPPLQDVVDTLEACEICPVRKLCRDHNNFHCLTSGMFTGYYCGVNDALDICHAWHEETFVNENDSCMVCGSGPKMTYKVCNEGEGRE